MYNSNINNFKIGIVVQARTCSTRLPDKIIKPFFEGESILIILINRLKKCEIPVIIATTTNEKDDVICSFCNKYDIKYYRGSEEDVLKRFIDAATKYKLNIIIRVCSDNPFIDDRYIAELINNYTILKNKPDYYSYTLNKKPIIREHIGTFTELITLKTLQDVYKKTKKKLYHEHVTNYIYDNKSKFNIILQKTPKYLHENNLKQSIRLTVDTQKDFDLLKILYCEIRLKYGVNFTLENTLDHLSLNNDKYIPTMKQLITHNPK